MRKSSEVLSGGVTRTTDAEVLLGQEWRCEKIPLRTCEVALRVCDVMWGCRTRVKKVWRELTIK